MRDITAILITGGTGTRLRPIAGDYVKSMLPWMGRPLLENTIRQLHRAGITDLVLTSPGKSGEICRYFADGRAFSVSMEYAVVDRWRGTAGTVARVVRALDRPSRTRFLVIYGDSLLSTDFAKLVQVHVSRRGDATLLSHRPRFEAFRYDYHDGAFPDEGPRTNYGVMDAESGDEVSFFEEKPLLKKILGLHHPTANAAVYVLERAVFDAVPSTDASCDFATDLFPALLRRHATIFRHDIGASGHRIDLGTLGNYYNAILAALKGDIVVNWCFPERGPGTRIASDAAIAASPASVHHCVIAEGCDVGPACTVARSVLGKGVIVGSDCVIHDSVIMDGTRIGEGVSLERCMIGEECSIAAGTQLPPGSVLGSHCRMPSPALQTPYEDFRGQLTNERFDTDESH